jgi:hypothetical protein
MAERGIDTLLVSSPEGMCYLHGYQARWYRAHCSTLWLPLAVTVVRVDEPSPLHFDFERERELLAATSVVDEVCYYQGDGQALTLLAGELAARGWLNGCVGLEYWSTSPTVRSARWSRPRWSAGVRGSATPAWCCARYAG